MGKLIQLDVSPNGIQHSVEVDENGFGYFEHQTTADEQIILDDCARLRGLAQRKGSAFQFAGKIPLVTHALWKKEWREKHRETFTWPTFLAMKMNNRDYGKLKVLDGKLPTAKRRHV